MTIDLIPAALPNSDIDILRRSLKSPDRETLHKLVDLLVDKFETNPSTFQELEARAKDVGAVFSNAILRMISAGNSGRLAEIKELLPLTILGTDGVERKRIRIRTRVISTLFGDIEVERRIYESPYVNAETLKPYDAVLNLPLYSYSPGIVREICHNAVQKSFSSTVIDMKRSHGVSVPIKQVQSIIHRAAVDVDDYLQDTKPLGYCVKKGETGNGLVCLEFDHKGIPLMIEDLRGKTKMNAKAKTEAKPKYGLLVQPNMGPRKDYKRTATVAVSYLLEKRVRSLEEIIPPSEEEVHRNDGKKDSCSIVIEPGRSRPSEKRVISSIELETAEVIRRCFGQGRVLDPHYEKAWVCLCDGEKGLQDAIEAEARRRKMSIHLVLDIFHVTEYLWEICRGLFSHDQKRAREQWIRTYLELLLKGQAKEVIKRLKRESGQHRSNSKMAQAISGTITYLSRNIERMKYDVYLKNGFPIASGVVEGACRHIIGDRLDATGARWTLEGAEALLALRCIWASGELDRYLSYHNQKEFTANYQDKIVFPTELKEGVKTQKDCGNASFWCELRQIMSKEAQLSSYEVQ
jgi:hypothetical protein